MEKWYRLKSAVCVAENTSQFFLFWPACAWHKKHRKGNLECDLTQWSVSKFVLPSFPCSGLPCKEHLPRHKAISWGRNIKINMRDENYLMP